MSLQNAIRLRNIYIKKKLSNLRLKKISQIKNQHSRKQMVARKKFFQTRLFQRIKPQIRSQIKPQVNNKRNNKGSLELLLKNNKSIKKIVSCYKENVMFGLGDFIRGSLYIFQVCDKYNVNYDVLFTNVLSRFLKTNNKSEQYNNTPSYDLNHGNNNLLVNYKYNSTIKLTTNTFNLNNNFSPFHKKLIKEKLEPNEEVSTIVENILSNINYTKNDYILIHIRTGDTDGNTIDTKSCNTNLLNNIYEKIKFYEEYLNKNKIFVVSDNTYVKTKLKEKYNFECLLNNISHFADKNASIESYKNTYIDFLLLSYSKQIISFSIYDNSKGHGSGFSYWPSVIYDIPYYFIKINKN